MYCTVLLLGQSSHKWPTQRDGTVDWDWEQQKSSTSTKFKQNTHEWVSCPVAGHPPPPVQRLVIGKHCSPYLNWSWATMNTNVMKWITEMERIGPNFLAPPQQQDNKTATHDEDTVLEGRKGAKILNRCPLGHHPPVGIILLFDISTCALGGSICNYLLIQDIVPAIVRPLRDNNNGHASPMDSELHTTRWVRVVDDGRVKVVVPLWWMCRAFFMAGIGQIIHLDEPQFVNWSRRCVEWIWRERRRN